MMPLELLVMIGAGAVLPYIAEEAFDWVRRNGAPAKRTTTPD